MPAINRYYSSVAIDTTLSSSITNTATSFIVASTAGFPTSYPYTLAIGFDSSSEELVTVVAASSTTLTVGTTVAGGANIAGRGVDGTTAVAHNAAEVVKHVISARDLTEAQAHIAATATVHGLTGTVVGTTDTQTLTNKTISSASNTLTVAQSAVTNLTTDLALKAPLASPTFTGTVILPTGTVTSVMIADGAIVNADINASAAIDWTKLAVSSTVSSTEISYVDGVTSAIQTQLDSKAPLASTYTAKTASYTFASGDEGKLFSMNNAATQQFNIPTDATFNFAVGTEINVFWITGAGQPTIGAVTPGTTTVISTAIVSNTPKLRAVNSGATCKKLAADSWIVFGDLL
jgi:hypothetical protein